MVLGIGERLKKLRADNKYSQGDVADLLKVSHSLISAYETGDRIPPVDKLIGLADIYHTSTDYILGRKLDSSSGLFIRTDNMTSDEVHSLIVMAESLNSKPDSKKR